MVVLFKFKFNYPWRYVRFIAQYMEKLPIADISDFAKEEIEDRVRQILADPAGPEVVRLEKEIDQLVYQLYNLTPEEIALVEGKK
jgi:adenine-specific DNA-methyltransferase